MKLSGWMDVKVIKLISISFREFQESILLINAKVVITLQFLACWQIQESYSLKQLPPIIDIDALDVDWNVFVRFGRVLHNFSHLLECLNSVSRIEFLLGLHKESVWRELGVTNLLSE